MRIPHFHLFGGLCLLAAMPVFALNITTDFADRGVGAGLAEGRDCRDFAVSACDVEKVVIENGVPVFIPYAACGHDADLIDHMQAAAALWEDIIEDDHDLTVHFWWVADSAPTTHIMQTDGEGRPTEAAICLPADLNWYYDPLPGNDDEFQLAPKLFRSLHPTERTESLVGEPPEILELAYNGPRESGGGVDMLTIALHEMGHAVGLAPSIASNPPVVSCTKPDPFYALPAGLVGGAAVLLKAFEFINSNTNMSDWDCGHLALGGIKACRTPEQQLACEDGDPDTPCPDSTSTLPGSQPPYTVGYCLQHQALMWFGQVSPASFRQHPDTASILAVREAADWQRIDLPRKFSLGPGQWHTAGVWLGNRVPDGGDDVFVVNQLVDADIDVFSPASARNLTVTDGNLVRVLFAQLELSGTAHVRERLPGDDDLILEPPDPGDIGILPEISRLEVDGSNLNAAAVVVGEHGRLDVGFGGVVKATRVGNAEGGVVRGMGLVRTDHLDNRGTIASNGGPMRLQTITPAGGIVLDPPAFDLDGVGFPESDQARLRALTGDLVFDGPITDPVNADIQVGAGHRLVFTRGWTQVTKFNTNQRLELLGGTVGATVEGVSTVAGRVEPQGIGRFTDPAVFTPAAVLTIDIGGLLPGAEHDQLQFQQSVELAGTLNVQLDGGFLPEPGDEFIILNHAGSSGEFFIVNGLEIAPDRQFVLHYEPTRVRLAVLPVLQADNDGGVLIGTNADEILQGGDGKDILLGRGGNDILIGGADNDILIGGNGDDDLQGGEGNDILIGGSGDDDLRGEAGDDILRGQGGMDALDGGADSDICNGGGGTDTAINCES